jgi:2-(acetamidomethylene)succinate hydrolase
MSSHVIETDADGLRHVRGDSIDLAFTVRGSGPVVVLLHGTSANHAVWSRVAEALESRATVVCVDQRGHGRSAKPSKGYDAPDFADDVVLVLDALSTERAMVGGHSLGARNAWVAAARHPERVSGVLAVDYTPYVESHVLDALAVRVAAGDRAFGSPDEIRSYLAQRYPRMPVDAVARRAEWGYRCDANGAWHPLAPPGVLAQVVDGLRVPYAAEFAAVTVPMTHLRGADSRIVTDAAWDPAQASRPDDRWVVAPGLDHYVPEEDPTLVSDEIVSLLERD